MNAIEIIKKQENFIKRKYGISKIGVFGSFARGEEKEGSDIDVLAHEYFGINYKIMWDIIKNKLPALQNHIQTILEKETTA